MRPTGIIYSFIILLICNYAKAQFYVNGTDNPNQKLQQIETNYFKVIFPEGYVQEANKLANMLEHSCQIASHTLQNLPHKKIPVLLHTGKTVSNAFVTWAPRRTEINYLPPQREYSQSWLEHVALHEIRHVIQIDKMESGVNKIFKYLFGQISTGAVAGLYPLWAYEGDAVVTETALTKSGRGRSPSFTMGLKAITLENEKPFTYEKAYYGSFNKYVPSYYTYGYNMSAFARIHHDSLIWSKVLNYLPRKPFNLYPTYFALKKYYGTSKKQLYAESMQYLKETWEKESEGKVASTTINKKEKKEYTDYRFPVVTETGSVICLKTQRSKIDCFVEIDSVGGEKKIAVPGIHSIDRLSYGGGILVWAEQKKHPRWENEEYSVIRTYNTKTKKYQILGRGSNYMAPAINKSGTKIVTIEAGLPGFENMVIFDLESKTKNNVLTIENANLQIPSWHYSGNKIVYTKITHEGKFIEEIDLLTGKTKELFGPVFIDLLSPVYYKNFILFSASYTGTDNIFALNSTNSELYKITNVPYGVFDPQSGANVDKVIFSEYSSGGYNIGYVNFNENNLMPYNKEVIYETELVKRLSKQEPDKYNLHPNDYKNYSVKKYERWKHLFNGHSWLPLNAELNPEDIFNGGIYPGATVFTQNITGTLYGWAGYSYRNGFHFGNVNLTYRGLFPVISLNYEQGWKDIVTEANEHSSIFADSLGGVKDLNLNTYVPLVYYVGSSVLRIQPGVRVSYQSNDYYFRNDGWRKSISLDTRYSFYMYYYKKLARKDLYPRLGIYSSFRYYQDIKQKDLGDMYQTSLRLYLPGLFNNHSLRLAGNFQAQFESQYRYTAFFMPRGQMSQYVDQIEMFSADYSLPLFYPDWSLGSILYIKRFKTNMFYDKALAHGIFTGDRSNPYINKEYESVGIDISADVHIAHFVFPLSMGARLTYNTQTGETIIGPLFSYDLGNF